MTREVELYRPVWVALVGCSTPPEGDAWIAPFDGATSVPLDARLRVETGHLDLPDGYPIDPATVTAATVPGAGAVRGALRRVDDDVITFTPDDGFEPVRTYRWEVAEPEPVRREIRPELPPDLVGAQGFSTSDVPHLLEARLEAGALCLLFSEPFASGELAIGVAGAPPRPVPFTVVDPLADVPIDDHLPDAGGVCPDDALGAEPGDTLTYVSQAGVTDEVDVTEGTITDAALARHRFTAAP